MRIACVGGGPTGLYFALLMKLHDSGHDVTVFERNGTDSTYGWGVTFGADLLAKLYHSDPMSAREIDQAAFHWVDQIVDVQGKPVQRASGDGYSIKRQRLLDIMAERAKGLGAHVEFDHEVRAPAELLRADLIVACDGVNSRTRLAGRRFQTDVGISANKYLWLGTSKVFESFMYAFVPTASGWVWAYAYGVDAESSTFIVECSPATWTGLGLDAMPPHDNLRLLGKLFERQLDGHPLVGQDRAGVDVRWLNFRTITNQRWHDGKIVLAGDAAHTTHYSIGWGTKLAIEDAISLAENVQHQNTLEVALKSYQAQRYAALLPPRGEARCSARWFENISRYIDLEPHQFAMLLHGRRSPVLPHVAPRLYGRLLRATEDITVLRELRMRLGPRAKAAYGRRYHADDSPAVTDVPDVSEN